MIRARVAIAQETMSDTTIKLSWRIAEFGKRLTGSVTVPLAIAPAFAAWLRAGAVWLARGERLP